MMSWRDELTDDMLDVQRVLDALRGEGDMTDKAAVAILARAILHLQKLAGR